jgi:hypothetical protein
MKLLEKIPIILSIISLALMFNQVPGGAWMLMISLSVLACIYFPLGFLFFSQISMRQLFKDGLNTKSRSTIVKATFTGLGLSTLCMGILFRLLHYPVGNDMLITGIVISVIMLGILVYNIGTSRSPENTLCLSRLAVFILISVALLFTSSETIPRLQYKDHAAYVDALSGIENLEVRS